MSRVQTKAGAARAAAVLLIAMSLVAAACGSSTKTTNATKSPPTTANTAIVYHNVLQASGGTPKSGGSLVYGIEGETNGWNPALSQWAQPGLTVASSVYDPMMAWGPNYDVKPYLAQSVTHDADYKLWTITLRPNITFSDGEPLDAAAVVTDFDAVLGSALTSNSFAPVSAFTATGPLTLTATMTIPWVAFPAALTSQVGYIAAPKMIEAKNTTTPIGTGPFVLSSWVPNSEFVAKKNPHYWRAGLPYLDEVTFKPITDGETALASLQSGDIDMWATSLDQFRTKLVADAAKGQIQLVYSRGETEENLTMLNTQVAPMNDLRVRQALAYATDRKTWAAATGVDPASIANGPFAPGSKWYIPVDYPQYDLAKATALVKSYEADHGPVSFTLQCNTDTTVAQTCQILQSQWEKAGMAVKIVGTDENTLITNAVGGAYQATIWRQFGEQDPDADFVWWDSANTKPPLALNMARNIDPTLDAALYNGRTSHIEKQRQLDYITVARQLDKDLPYIWLNHTVWSIGANNAVRGFDQTTLPDGSKTDPVTSGVQRVTQLWLTNG
jgi:peptide/nickel transport system substrate-binding protein